MKNLCIFLLCLCALENLTETLAAKRIKREAETEGNRAKISKDFAVIQNKGDKDAKDNKKTGAEKGVLDSLKDGNTDIHNRYVNTIESIGPEKHHHADDPIKKRGLASPPTYVSRKRERKSDKKRNSTHTHTSQDKLTSNSPMSEEADFGDKKSNIEIMGDVTNLPTFGKGSANIVGTHVVLPPQSIVYPSSLGPFTPIDQLVRYANMLLYNVGLDSMPSHPQYAMMSPLRTASQLQDITVDNKDIPNSLGSSQHHSYRIPLVHSLPLNSDISKGQSGAMVYARPWFVKTPKVTKESDELIEILENAFDNDATDNEGEANCPLHHNKKNLGNFDKNDLDDEGVIQVCSCHFIKNNKDMANKDFK